MDLLGSQPQTSLRAGRVAGDEAEARLAELLGACFPVPEGGSFYDDFPVWDPAQRMRSGWTSPFQTWPKVEV